MNQQITQSPTHRTAALLAVAILCFATANAQDKSPVTFNEDVKPILRQHCLKCHGDDKQESGLNLQNYQAAIKGGSGGAAVVAGRASSSLLYQVITNEDAEARMPPNQPPLPDEQVGKILAWINDGLRESVDSQSMLSKRDLNFTPMAGSVEDAAGPLPMPENWPTVKLQPQLRAAPIMSMDASPRAPVVAVGGWKFVRLVHTESEADLGVLSFPEGTPQVIRFSNSGNVLMVAGGKPVQSGRVVLFDVRTGKRLAEIGDEVDSVLAADLSPDQTLVALGGSGKIVKIYDTTNGILKFKLDRHTDWITSMTFSPDGTKLATADRAGGLHIWDTAGGGILLTLPEHKLSVGSLAWRSDSRILASASEDGLLIWWDTIDGWPAITRNNAHPPTRPEGYYGNLRKGVLCVAFGPTGTLVSAGRDHVVRLWNTEGNVQKSFDLSHAVPLTTRISHDGNTVIIGDKAGQLHFMKP